MRKKKLVRFLAFWLSVVMLVFFPTTAASEIENEAVLPSLEERAAMISEGMTYAEVKECMGSDGEDMGSDLIWYQWTLSEQKVLWIWLSNLTNATCLDEYTVIAVEIHEQGAPVLSLKQRARAVDIGMNYAEARKIMRCDGVRVGSSGFVYEWDLSENQFLLILLMEPKDKTNAAYPDDWGICNVILENRDESFMENRANYIGAGMTYAAIRDLMGRDGTKSSLNYVGQFSYEWTLREELNEELKEKWNEELYDTYFLLVHMVEPDDQTNVTDPDDLVVIETCPMVQKHYRWCGSDIAGDTV